jgi:hypothetical protein
MRLMGSGYPSRNEAETGVRGPAVTGTTHLMETEETPAQNPEDEAEKPGAEGGSDSPSADRLPGAPADDDAPLGDTDQHSDA